MRTTNQINKVINDRISELESKVAVQQKSSMSLRLDILENEGKGSEYSRESLRDRLSESQAHVINLLHRVSCLNEIREELTK
jgi:uncharacterized coiled-coil protein SlyX